jgi:radical SAM protein with 4Fe4S-binding SPASM domain
LYDILNVYLENGLRVIMHKIPHVKTMACGVWIKQGSKHENDEENGLSHLVEHLMINIENDSNPKFKKLINEVSSEEIVYNAETTIQPNGDISPCSLLAEKNILFGRIRDDGRLSISDKNRYFNFKNYVVTNQKKCSECIEVPLCGGPCMYKNIMENNICDNEYLDWVSLEEKIKLLFHKDLLNNNIKEL